MKIFNYLCLKKNVDVRQPINKTKGSNTDE